MAATKKDRLLMLIKDLLLERGWEMATNESSGAFTKNNFIFVLHGYESADNETTVGCRSIQPYAKPVISYKGASWHVEQYGFLVDKGAVPGLVVSAANSDGSDLSAAEAFANSIDKYSLLGDAELLPMKQCEKSYTMKERCLVPVRVEGSVVEEKRFILNPSTGTDFEMVFTPGTVYEITKFSNGTDPTNAMRGAKVTYTAYNEECSALTKQTGSLDLELFAQLCDAGVLVPVQLQPGMKDISNTQWVNVTTDACLPVPPEFDNFGLNASQRVVLSKALGAAVNFTPLLNANLSDGEAKAMLTLLKDGGDAECLINKQFTEDQLLALDEIAKAGFSIKFLANEKYTADYIRNQFNGTLSGLERLRTDLTAQGFEQKNVQAVIQVAYDSGMKIIQRDNEPSGVLALKYVAEHAEGDLKQLADILLAGRILDHEGNVLVNLVSVPSNLRSSIYEYFAVPSTECAGSITCNWPKTFNSILSSSDYLCYSARRGFGLKFGNNTLFRDFNSVCVCDLVYDPVWRGVVINEKLYCNKEFWL